MSEGLAQLKKDLAEKNPARLYLFHGEESYLKSHYLGMLQKLCAGAFPDFDLIKLDGDTLTLDDVRDAIESLPMGGERKLVRIMDYDVFGSGVLKETILDIVAELPEYVCVVFVYDALEFKVDKRLNLWKEFQKYCTEVEFKQASGNDLNAWIKRRFSALGKEISSADCERLVFLCGGLMDNLITEIEKIAAGTPERIIRTADIEKMASRTLEAGVFDLTDALSENNLQKALLILRDLLDMKNSGVAITAVITKHFKRLYGARLAMDRGLSLADTVKLLEYRSDYPARKAMSTAGRFSVRRLRRAQRLCMEADVGLKSNNADEKRIIELLIMRIMA